MSWPIGAAEISAALEGAPNGNRLELSFWDFVSVAADRRLQSDSPQSILTATHYGDVSILHAEWSIEIRAVLRERRRLAHELLLRDGLPAVRRWLEASTEPNWLLRPRGLRVTFDPARGVMHAEEHVGP